MDKATYERGLAIRTAVLGEQYVSNALKSADQYSTPMQQLVTEYCWGAVWCRDGLDRKTRSFLNLAMLSALNRPHELETHVRGALNNGITREEICEAFLQVAIYCGVPVGLDSMRVARKVFAELDAKK
jgi:4-carboxymuconolactone decarboxylase